MSGLIKLNLQNCVFKRKIMIRLIPDNTKIKFTNLKRKAFIFSLFLSLLSAVSVIIIGLNLGIDFRGGILIEIRTDNIDVSDIRKEISTIDIGEVSIQEFGVATDFLIRVEKQVGSDSAQQIAIEKIKNKLNQKFEQKIEYRRLELVGPTISKDLIKKGIMAIIFAVMAMLVYIWFRFELPFAMGAVIALLHDIVLTLGVFSAIGLEFNLATVAAILLIIGYSMNDTVVVYDRIRENLRKFKKMNFEDLIDKSVNETLTRTINTTATTILALGALYFIGGEIIADFSFAMLWGIIVGTYSSIFIASTMLTYLNVRSFSENKEK